MKRTQRKTKAPVLPKSKATNAYELLDEVCALIIEEPLRYDQSSVICRIDAANDADPIRPSMATPRCGTIGCVAGWVTTLKHGWDFGWIDALDRAETILGIDSKQGSELFWAGAVLGKPQSEEHAALGVAHIRAFQQKYEAQLKAKAV